MLSALRKTTELFNLGHPKKAGQRLFNGDDALFKAVLSEAARNAEYGCGASTLWVNAFTDVPIVSVDTSRDWLDHVARQAVQPERLTLHHVDLGELGKWGRPKSYAFADRFADYTNSIWDGGSSPDVVLIDGRFRVACFLTCLIEARSGTRILFDDYADREQYHIVEEFTHPVERCGRQALFEVPGQEDLDRTRIDDLITRFRYVMD
ncbi:hypothetical protein [Salibaculum griseiflavum]|uniref:Class I SAM-dependent methyltransferase n=1 Tax=Salibaculum griseiflavum TaxID=1914409 RepID=A0A2V1P2G0_9RHOB|nr:hypothetical protein [Salibaculum griseiflavum]PWG15950.1 hypothetical protein DFK10_14295 [Salibaculum griseiflavum]